MNEEIKKVEVIEKVSKKKVSKKRKKKVVFSNKEGKEVKCLDVKKGERVGDYSRRMIKVFGNSVKNEVLSKMIGNVFKDSKVNYKHVGWYKSDLRKMGDNDNKWG
jgi:hypothetical protein